MYPNNLQSLQLKHRSCFVTIFESHEDHFFPVLHPYLGNLSDYATLLEPKWTVCQSSSDCCFNSAQMPFSR